MIHTLFLSTDEGTPMETVAEKLPVDVAEYVEESPLSADGEADAAAIVDRLPEGVTAFVDEYGRDGTLALGAGAVTLFQGLRAMRTDSKSGLMKLLWGGAWVMVGLTQRRLSKMDDEVGDQSFQSEDSMIGGDEDDVDDVTPGETEDDMAAQNTLPQSDVGRPEGHDDEAIDDTKNAAEPAEMTGPSQADAAPEKDKTTVPDEPPEGVSMAGADDEEDASMSIDHDDEVSAAPDEDDGSFGSEEDDISLGGDENEGSLSTDADDAETEE